MDLAAGCKDKLQHFRIKELKDVLTKLGFSKQGKKQDLVDRILCFLVDDQASKTWAKRPALSKEELARLVDDIYRKMQGTGAATDLASKVQCTSETATTALKPKEEVDDSLHVDMKVRCPCGSSLLTETMIQCEDPRCQIWQHISCVIIPEKPMDGIPPTPPSQFYCEVCRLNRADPFWSTLGHPLFPVKLIPNNAPTDGTNPVQIVEKTFHLSRTDRDLLSKPEYAVQAWCMLLNDKVCFRMQWPQYADLQINGFPVRALSRPGSQLLGANGRDDGPNISQCTREGINKIFLSGCDARIFCLGVRLVKRRPLQQILSMIPKELDGEIFEDALARVRRCIGGGEAENADSDSDLEVVTESITVNLRCPMSGSRMKTAGRFRPCAHMGCFDLETFVEMQQRSRKWQCPICLKNYSLESIIIDPYFNRIANMMQSCGEDTTEIEVKPDGSWRVKGENECKDLRQWHLPDGSICLPDEGELKHKPEASKPVKPEGTGLKLGIRKNSNGLWEVSKHGDMNTFSSSDRIPENLENGGLKVIPMSSSATISGRDGEDPSVNQDATVNFDLSVTNGVELDSISLNLDPTFGLTTQNALAAAKDANVIVLSDSDSENGMMVHGIVHNNGLMDNGVNYTVNSHGITGSYQTDAGLGVGGSSCLDLFNPADDEFGLPIWPGMPSTTQGASSFQLFGSDGDGSDTLGNPHLSAVNCSTSMNGYMLAPETAMNPAAFVPDSAVNHPSHDLNDGLVDNPLAFGGEDPSLQIFLPTRPSDTCGSSDVRNHQDMANGLSNEDWISLRLGDGGGRNPGDSGAVNGLHIGQQPHSRDGNMDSLAETGARESALHPHLYNRPNTTLHISRATLGEGEDGDFDNGTNCNDDRSLLSFKFGDNPDILICSLRFKTNETTFISLDFQPPIDTHTHAHVVFSVKDPRHIHLVGYLFHRHHHRHSHSHSPTPPPPPFLTCSYGNQQQTNNQLSSSTKPKPATFKLYTQSNIPSHPQAFDIINQGTINILLQGLTLPQIQPLTTPKLQLSLSTNSLDHLTGDVVEASVEQDATDGTTQLITYNEQKVDHDAIYGTMDQAITPNQQSGVKRSRTQGLPDNYALSKRQKQDGDEEDCIRSTGQGSPDRYILQSRKSNRLMHEEDEHDHVRSTPQGSPDQYVLQSRKSKRLKHDDDEEEEDDDDDCFRSTRHGSLEYHVLQSRMGKKLNEQKKQDDDDDHIRSTNQDSLQNLVPDSKEVKKLKKKLKKQNQAEDDDDRSAQPGLPEDSAVDTREAKKARKQKKKDANEEASADRQQPPPASSSGKTGKIKKHFVQDDSIRSAQYAFQEDPAYDTRVPTKAKKRKKTIIKDGARAAVNDVHQPPGCGKTKEYVVEDDRNRSAQDTLQEDPGYDTIEPTKAKKHMKTIIKDGVRGAVNDGQKPHAYAPDFGEAGKTKEHFVEDDSIRSTQDAIQDDPACNAIEPTKVKKHKKKIINDGVRAVVCDGEQPPACAFGKAGKTNEPIVEDDSTRSAQDTLPVPEDPACDI